MKKNRLNRRIFGLIMGIILLMAFGPICIGEETTETELGIDEVAGHIGGILDKIDIYHECSGCSQCGTTLDPGAIKTESTQEEGFIFGFGQVEIIVTASASNADEVISTSNGLVIGPFIIIT